MTTTTNPLPDVEGECLTPLERLYKARVFLAEALVQEGNNNGNVLLLIELAQDEVNRVAEARAAPTNPNPEGERP